MPRIRTWHRVAHDFNRDPEVRELRRRYGDWMGYVWLEMLSIADRKEGRITGETGEISEAIAHTTIKEYKGKASKNIEKAFSFMVERGWIWIGKDYIQVLKYANYRGSREHIEIHKGKRKDSLLDKTRLDKKRQEQDKDSCSEQPRLPEPTGQAPEISPFILEILGDCRYLMRLADPAHRDFWDNFLAIVEPYELNTAWLNTTLRRWNQWFEDNPTKRSRSDKRLRSRLLMWLDKDLDQQARRK